MAANATTADELPRQPRRASWKRWTLALAYVFALALAVLFVKPRAPEPVSVRFLGSTNDNGQKKLLFEGTNGLTNMIRYVAFIAWSPTNEPQSIRFIFLGQRMGSYAAGPRETFKFSLDAPPKNTDWHVSWSYSDPAHAPTRMEKIHARCYDFFMEHHMPILARPLKAGIHMYSIPSTDLKD